MPDPMAPNFKFPKPLRKAIPKPVRQQIRTQVSQAYSGLSEDQRAKMADAAQRTRDWLTDIREGRAQMPDLPDTITDRIRDWGTSSTLPHKWRGGSA